EWSLSEVAVQEATVSSSAQRSPKPKDGPPHGASPEWFRHKGLEVAVHRAGEHGPGVVLLHNGGTSHSIWRHQLADLATDHRVVAVDLPGFGASPLPSQPSDLEPHVAPLSPLTQPDERAPVRLVA